ncbi:hypothetical protein K7711_09270 [Nocardia sp. CA2R105]|uniref:hypothetical protein n=1 Tax=Nocardia coffeae TaxID=2873381 RepID=UPI001CA77950|nr:hypothetical protein [Nocardia coffeae]MBY8856663.1 hypothetical protein [Nocardia coffeae]
MVRLSCLENIIRIDVPEGEFRIQLSPLPTGRTRLTFRAAFRAQQPSNGTWWSSWDCDVSTTSVSDVLVSDVREQRSKFARTLADACLTEK